MCFWKIKKYEKKLTDFFRSYGWKKMHTYIYLYIYIVILENLNTLMGILLWYHLKISFKNIHTFTISASLFLESPTNDKKICIFLGKIFKQYWYWDLTGFSPSPCMSQGRGGHPGIETYTAVTKMLDTFRIFHTEAPRASSYELSPAKHVFPVGKPSPRTRWFKLMGSTRSILLIRFKSELIWQRSIKGRFR